MMAADLPPASPIGPGRDEIVRRLLDPAVYPEPTRAVRLVETHVSQVFLTDAFVYKLKKPVRFDFLDFSTIEKREQACRDELRLNRRMAHDTYLSVVPLTWESTGELSLGGAGPAIDWLVRMRRLPAERMLDELIRSAQLSAEEVRRLADALSHYYATAEPSSVPPAEFHAALVAHTQGNYRALSASRAVDPPQLRNVHSAQLRLLKCRPELFHRRVFEGRIIDGHGDLRPEHVCLTDPPAVFDCVEFSADLRRVDALDELCFLAMECDLLQAPGVGRRVLDAYSARSHDRPSGEIVPFYKSYRACVRAKIAALRAEQLVADAQQAQIDLARRYLDLAERYVRDAGTRPLLLVVGGLMGTGKSTLARRLAEELAMEPLRTDDIRRQLLPADGRAEAFGAGRYRAEVRVRVYDEMFRQASDRLVTGSSVILDGTFTRAADRETAVRLGRERNAEVRICECVCPRDTAVARIRRRLSAAEPDASEARPELYDLQAAERAREGSSLIDSIIDATEPLEKQAARVFAALPVPFSRG